MRQRAEAGTTDMTGDAILAFPSATTRNVMPAFQRVSSTGLSACAVASSRVACLKRIRSSDGGWDYNRRLAFHVLQLDGTGALHAHRIGQLHIRRGGVWLDALQSLYR